MYLKNDSKQLYCIVHISKKQVFRGYFPFYLTDFNQICLKMTRQKSTIWNMSKTSKIFTLTKDTGDFLFPYGACNTKK